MATDWNRQYEKVLLNEKKVPCNMNEYKNNVVLKENGIYGYKGRKGLREQDGAPAPDAPQGGQGGQPAPSQGPQAGQETGFSDDWNGIKDQVGDFIQQSIQDLYNSVEDPDKQNDLVNRVIGPAIKTVLLNNPNANIPYKELHSLLKGGQDQQTPEGEEGTPPAEGGDQGGQVPPPAPAQGGQQAPPPQQ